LKRDESLKHLSTPEGVKVGVHCLRRGVPDLVDPVQMNFDTRGTPLGRRVAELSRTTPTTKVFDKLLVFDIDPATGKFTKCTTFLDGLNCPTGFQLYKDGVLVMQVTRHVVRARHGWRW